MRKVYGYTPAADGLLEILPEQAAVVQEIYRQYLSGKSLGGIANFLFENHIPSPSGKEKWSVSVLDTMLTNNKYIGKMISFEDYFAVQVEKGKRISQNAPSISEVQLKRSICEMLGMDEFDAQVIKDRLDSIQVTSDGSQKPEMVFHEFPCFQLS